MTIRSYAAEVLLRNGDEWVEFNRFKTENEAARFARAAHAEHNVPIRGSRARPSENYYNAKLREDGSVAFVNMRVQSMREATSGEGA